MVFYYNKIIIKNHLVRRRPGRNLPPTLIISHIGTYTRWLTPFTEPETVTGGFEPPTSRLTAVRYYRLSYATSVILTNHGARIARFAGYATSTLYPNTL